MWKNHSIFEYNITCTSCIQRKQSILNYNYHVKENEKLMPYYKSSRAEIKFNKNK